MSVCEKKGKNFEGFSRENKRFNHCLRAWVNEWIRKCSSVVWGASLVVQRVKRLPAMQETWVQFLGWEDPLEKEMATHFSTLAWKISWTEEPGR